MNAAAAVRSDLTKIRTLRSTAWTLALTVAGCAGLAYLVSLSFRSSYPTMSADTRERFDAVFPMFYSVTIGQLALVVFGVLAISSEYSSGTIRASLAAVPRRGLWYAGKVLAVGAVALAVSVPTVLITFAAARSALGPYGPALTDDGVPSAVVGAVLYLVLICLFALGVATMLRSAAYTLGILLPLFVLGSQGLGNVPRIRSVTQYLPDQAGTVILHLAGRPDSPEYARSYGPWTGLGILALWTLAALAGGYLLVRRRDA